jgi:predicted GH43/DUF377 family glycosyl hydrolase
MMLQEQAAALDHDPSRVVARFFVPGEGLDSPHSRLPHIVSRALAEPPDVLEAEAARVLADLDQRHEDAETLLLSHAWTIDTHLPDATDVSREQALVLGAAFTAEFAVEGAALCNPSAVAHPSQDGLADGELRVAVSLRCIGEGHKSSIGFAEAVIGTDGQWRFAPRSHHATAPRVRFGEWSRAHFGRALEEDGSLNGLTNALLNELPEQFGHTELEEAIVALPDHMAYRPDIHRVLQVVRDLATSAYHSEFAPTTPLSSRTLLPVTVDERNGIEDARFVQFTDADGTTDYRATYTAYDGRHIASRLLVSHDLANFSVHRLTGGAAHDKGIALFPRLVGGRHLALTRSDGESITLAESEDGMRWRDTSMVHPPTRPWEIIQVGNCGSPIETEEGWLVLTHGVGALRTYSLGALLLDLDDPSRVIAQTPTPLLQPSGVLQEGYVPRVVYSCGAIAHAGTLWVPVGVGDNRIRVFSGGVDELIGSMQRR